MPRPYLILACLFALGLVVTAQARKHRSNANTAATATRSQEAAQPGHYDYYLMALSWSPTYCQTHADETDQCGHKGYGFILHGLWPQYEQGRGPERCESDDMPDRKTVAEALAFMPSRRLINHEWRAHGACTGLGPEQYFELADRAFASVHVPAELKAPQKTLEMSGNDLRAALRSANPALRDDMLTLHCSQGQLVEIRVCLDKDAGLRRCGKRLRNSCPATRTFQIPATR